MRTTEILRSLGLFFVLAIVVNSGGPASAATLGLSVFATGGQAVDATTQGTLDWAYWGPINGVTPGALAPVNSKDSGVGIGPLARIGTHGTLLDTTGLNSNHTWSYADGTSPAAAAGVSSGILFQGTATANSNAGNGFRLTIDADEQMRTVYLYGLTRRVIGQLSASLSDGSAVAAPLLYQNGDTGPVVLSIDFAASKPGQVLTLDWKANGVALGSAGGSAGGVRIAGATLTGPAYVDPLVAFRFNDQISSPAVNITPTFVGDGVVQNAALNINPGSGATLTVNSPPNSATGLLASTVPVLGVAINSTNAAAAKANNAYFDFTVASDVGRVSLQSLVFDVERGGTGGNRGMEIYSSRDGFTTPLLSIANLSMSRPDLQNFVIDLSDPLFQELVDPVTFRFYAFSDAVNAGIEFDNIRLFGEILLPVPEPSSLLLLCLGCVALRAKRNRSTARRHG